MDTAAAAKIKNIARLTRARQVPPSLCSVLALLCERTNERTDELASTSVRVTALARDRASPPANDTLPYLQCEREMTWEPTGAGMRRGTAIRRCRGQKVEGEGEGFPLRFRLRLRRWLGRLLACGDALGRLPTVGLRARLRTYLGTSTWRVGHRVGISLHANSSAEDGRTLALRCARYEFFKDPAAVVYALWKRAGR
ncbi:hypothetical protein PMIN01_13169 [Paraphaeosphaeria minitans]|uniref:Uncharacterized protein n=1 Tax=Paraphaeosphaeria minitans TaxID=565426 RepID=A0A9P6G4I1_9PLEO|nr:hypothetical protein PMIN01_13169 [Paraphaeosphaeria minitans]